MDTGNVDTIAFLIGRIIAGCFFIMNGFNHFAKLNMMSGYAKSKNIPAPALAVGGSGVLLFLGGLSLLLGYHPTIGSNPAGDFPPGDLIRYPQFLDGARSTSKDGGNDQLSEEHRHTRIVTDDLSRPETLADESWALTHKPES